MCGAGGEFSESGHGSGVDEVGLCGGEPSVCFGEALAESFGAFVLCGGGGGGAPDVGEGGPARGAPASFGGAGVVGVGVVVESERGGAGRGRKPEDAESAGVDGAEGLFAEPGERFHAAEVERAALHEFLDAAFVGWRAGFAGFDEDAEAVESVTREAGVFARAPKHDDGFAADELGDAGGDGAHGAGESAARGFGGVEGADRLEDALLAVGLVGACFELFVERAEASVGFGDGLKEDPLIAFGFEAEGSGAGAESFEEDRFDLGEFGGVDLLFGGDFVD